MRPSPALYAGDLAQATLARQAPLSVHGVLHALRGMAAESGAGAGQRRQRAVLSLLRSCREAEPKYLVRTLVGALRVGASWRSVVPALARAVVLHREGPRTPKASAHRHCNFLFFLRPLLGWATARDGR